jgi:hypothetical protein
VSTGRAHSAATIIGKMAKMPAPPLTDTEFALLLVDQTGWSLDRVEAWMVAALRSVVLGG